MQQRRNQEIKDLFEMLEYPDDAKYVGEEIDEMDLYDKELEDLEEADYEELNLMEEPE